MKINKLMLLCVLLAPFSNTFSSAADEIQPIAIEFLDQEDATVQPTDTELPTETLEETSALQASMPSSELSEEMLQPESAESLAQEIETALPHEQVATATKPTILNISSELTKIRDEIENMKSSLINAMSTIEGALRSVEAQLESF